MRLAELVRERVKRSGPFGGFLQCRRHGQDWNAGGVWCPSCEMAEKHNGILYSEAAAELGWSLDEPTADVPMVAKAGEVAK